LLSPMIHFYFLNPRMCQLGVRNVGYKACLYWLDIVVIPGPTELYCFPIPNSQFPIPNSQFPIPHS
ncbi:hypothetical protein QUB17_22610, partial [Microcoleus sp. B5-C4]